MICYTFISFTTYFGTNLLMVARVHKFLFFYFMSRNYLDKGKITKGALLELDSNSPEICPHQTGFRDRLGNAIRRPQTEKLKTTKL